MQVVGDLAVGTRGGRAVDPLDGDRADRGARGGDEAVLADLAGAVREFDLDRDVLAGPVGGRGGAVRGGDPEGGAVRRLRHPVGDGPLAPHVTGDDPLLGVEALLQGDQGVRHQPVDLVPGLGDLGGDGLAEDLGDRLEEVLVDDRVLLAGDAEAGVLVGDAAEHHVGPGVRVGEEVGGEGGDGARQGLLLEAGLLVAPVEEVADQGRVGREELGVEELGYVADGRPDGGQGGSYGRARLLGQHAELLA